ncbi:MAG TPA: GIY-YIG nuclease family protein [Polyangiaceae bacterium]|nr:GIY-YIG nuclease family protein [Polyangiaceae bacterium]
MNELFDKKFGADFLNGVPLCPGIYRYLGALGEVLYVGKAKNLRRRLSNYRLATRKKRHRKMRTLVRVATRLEIEPVATEQEALLLEGELIRSLRPPYNVDGAYEFLYPSIGVGSWDKHVLLCATTQPERYDELPLSFYGCFRSRPRVVNAFEALTELLSLLGHREKTSRLPSAPRLRGSRLVGFRQVPAAVQELIPSFFAGDDGRLPGVLARLLLAHPRARRNAADVQEHLKTLLHFFETDAARLRNALDVLGRPVEHVPRQERDALFIRAGFALQA